MAGNVDISKTAQIDFETRVHHNFINGGFQLKALLGTKWKKNTKNASKVRFNIGTEILAKKKTGTGSLVTQSKGGTIKAVYVYPEEYEVTSIVGQIEMDETGVFISQEFVNMHAKAMGLQTDIVILETLAGATIRDRNYFGGGAINTDKIDLTSYENSAPDKKDGMVALTSSMAGVGGSRTKYLVIDTEAHAKLLENEKFINDDYANKGLVTSGDARNRKFLGMEVILLEDLDEEFHGVSSLYELVGLTKTAFVVTEETLGVATHFVENSTSISKEKLLRGDYLIYSEMSLGCAVLSNRALFKIEYK